MGVSHTGPTLSWSASERSATSNWSGECVDSPISTSGAELLARLRYRHVVLAEVDAVGTRRACQVGAVVQPEQRAVLVAERAKPGGRAQDRIVVGVLVAQLDHVHPAAQGRAEHRLGRGLHHEVEPSSPEALTRTGEPSAQRMGFGRAAGSEIGEPGRLTLPRLAPNQRCSAPNCG